MITRLGFSGALACIVIVMAVAPVAAATYTVKIGDNFYNPSVRAVARGDTVTWRNNGAQGHTVTLKNGFTFFPSKYLGPGDPAFAKTFPGAGTFAYLCVIHSGQTGKVKVPIGLSKASGKIVVTVASSSSSGFRHRIERKPGSGSWTFVANTTATSYAFTPPSHGTWTVRARMESTGNGTTSGWAKKSIVW
jgi:plastocyanin